MVLRTVRGGDEDSLVPQVAVTIGVVMALMSLVVLIFFVHHVSRSLQAPNVISRVADELEEVLGRMCVDDERPREIDDRAHQRWADQVPERAPSRSLFSSRAGYIQAIDVEQLVETAERRD